VSCCSRRSSGWCGSVADARPAADVCDEAFVANEAFGDGLAAAEVFGDEQDSGELIDRRDERAGHAAVMSYRCDVHAGGEITFRAFGDAERISPALT
jgi:hypothetical protein